MLDLHHAVEGLRPADYNPRAIAPDALDTLQTSLHTFGFAKPIIVKPSGLIIAGHQRTKAAKACGITHVPAWVITVDVTNDDEVKFNQLHNGTDLETIDRVVRVRPAQPGEMRRFIELPAKDINGDHRSSQANTRMLVARLLQTYGNWGGCVATASGRVVSSPHYALTAAQIGMPVRTYYIEDDLEADALRIFSHQYGAFNYEHIPYIQANAQPYRLRSGGAKDQHSDLYEKIVIPQWGPRERLLDFGCGQADYLHMFQTRGRMASGIEFFHRRAGTATLDTKAVHHMIAEALGNWTRRGGYDLVVCDSVLNSVDTLTAENDVITCVQAFTKPGGRMFFSGRTRSGVEASMAANRSGNKNGGTRAVEFLDENGFTAYKRGDVWFFQKFATQAELTKLFESFGVTALMVTERSNKWFASMRKGTEPADAHIEAALRREFDLPWPNDTSVGRADEAVAAWLAARAKEVDLGLR